MNYSNAKHCNKTKRQFAVGKFVKANIEMNMSKPQVASSNS